jgi:hypothetical protein
MKYKTQSLFLSIKKIQREGDSPKAIPNHSY